MYAAVERVTKTRTRAKSKARTKTIEHSARRSVVFKEKLMRILLVEDEAPLRETLAARLKREGFAVDAAQDGEEGLYLGREMPFDVAIIDLGLPKLSGMDLLRAQIGRASCRERVCQSV